MLLIFVVNIALLLCLTRHALAQSTASLSISFVTPSAYVVGFTTQGTTIQTNEFDAFVELSLPAGTQEVYVVGVMQPNGAQAAYCVDCNIVDEKLVGNFKPFDTASTDGSTQQAALTGPFSLDPNAAYNLTIINTDPDPNRTLILDSLALTIQTSSTSSSVIPSSTATASLPVQPTTMSTPLSSPSATPSATGSPSAASTGDTSQQRTLAIVLSTVLGSIALLALLLGIFCLRRRRLRKTIQPAPSDDASSTTPVLQQQTVQLSSVSLAAAEAGAIATIRPLPQMPQMREVETPPSANQRVKPLPPVPSPPRSQEPTPQTPPRTPQTPSSGSLYSSSSARLSTRPPSAQPGSVRNSSSPRKSSLNLRRSSTRALRQYPPMPMPTDTTLSQAPKEWQTRVDPVLPRDTASPRHAHSPSVYSLGVFERERIERERVNSGMGDQEGGDVGGGFGFRWSRGTIIYPMTPSVSGEGLPDGWDP